MQVDPRLRRRRLGGEGVPRGAARVRGRRGDPRGARLPRSRASASARRSSTTSSSCAGSTSCVALGRPVLVGLSRKSSLGRILGDPAATTGTTAASVGAAVAAYERGATILRVHDVREHVEALARREGGASVHVKIELRGLELFGYHGVDRGGARARAAVPLRRRARGRRARRERPDRGRGRLPRGRRDGARGRRRAASALLEALADRDRRRAGRAASRRRARPGARAQAARCARPGSTVEFAPSPSSARDASALRRARREPRRPRGGDPRAPPSCSARPALDDPRDRAVGATPTSRAFLNAVAELETELPPRELLDRLLEVERELGRDARRRRAGGRATIDLDLLLYGERAIDEPGLDGAAPAAARAAVRARAARRARSGR